MLPLAAEASDRYDTYLKTSVQCASKMRVNTGAPPVNTLRGVIVPFRYLVVSSGDGHPNVQSKEFEDQPELRCYSDRILVVVE